MINPAASEAQEMWACVSPLNAWQSLVADFTSRELSRDSDTVLAIQGIADAISCLVHERYILGLWLEEIPTQLCWHIDMGKPEYRTQYHADADLTTFSGYKTPPLLKAPHRRQDFQAPSWTWLNSRHPVIWFGIDPNDADGLESMIEIIDIAIANDAHNKHRGHLQVEGVLMTAFAVSRQPNEWEHLVDPINYGNKSHSLYYDNVTWNDPRMICLAVAKTKFIVYCIVMRSCRKTFECTGIPQYQRIGYVECPADAWAWLMAGVPPKKDEASDDQVSLEKKEKAPEEISVPAGIDQVDWDSGDLDISANHSGFRHRRIEV
ncbi:MAG: hypothetical protein Q9170_002697 [Blastenia crenularia]